MLHRHLTDHGGARVRSLVVEPEGALDESYDVLLAGHRWSALTRALVDDVHARGRAVIGVYDTDEPAGRRHLRELAVDALVESDLGPDAFVRAITTVAGRRAPHATTPVPAPATRSRLVVVGGPPGTGRTEVAIELAVSLGRQTDVVLLDADDVAPAVAPRLQLPLEPSLRTAVDAVEHGRGDLAACVVSDRVSGLRAVPGLPSAAGWSHVRPGEIVRVAQRLGENGDIVVVDVAGHLEDVQTTLGRGRYAATRALLGEADVIVSVCDASPTGIGRLLAWIVDARALAPSVPLFVVANRAPSSRFRRGEMFEELMTTVPVHDVAFVPLDLRVADAAWNGTTVRRGGFTCSMAALADKLVTQLTPVAPPDSVAAAS
jgi:Mrp family chromosome partitioning ATPase